MIPKALLKRVVPKSAVTLYRAIRGSRPIHPRHCPICDYRGYFTHYGRSLRVDAMCPECGSLERHRLFWLWFEENKGAEQPVVHFAPEPVLERRLRERFTDYKTADLFMKGVDLKLNVEQLDLPDASVKTIICNHVLEHVDDRKALREMMRVLAPGGLLACSVPIVEGWDTTYEVPAITDPAERLLHYGQDDHIRFYGRDFRDRLKEAGFEVTEYTAMGPEVVTYGLMRGDKLFLCRKPAVH